jgi:hypothetical protein
LSDENNKAASILKPLLPHASQNKACPNEFIQAGVATTQHFVAWQAQYRCYEKQMPVISSAFLFLQSTTFVCSYFLL